MTPTLHGYQAAARDFLLRTPRAGLFLEPGLGKTLTTISALDTLKLTGEVDRTLLFAPLRVARDTWPDELSKWAPLHDLTHAVAVGTPAQRRAALAAGADVTIANVDSLVWILDEYVGERLPYDTLVIDELSLFKGRKGQRFKALQLHLSRFRRIIGLTGTPAPNSLGDLWAQMGVIDQGESLGKKFTPFRSKYFHLGLKPDGSTKDVRFDTSYELNPGADDEIYEAIRPRVISMRSADHLDLPPRTDNPVIIRMPKAVAADYRRFKRDQVLALPEGQLTAQNAAVLAGKLQQFANGQVYDEDRVTQVIHELKLDAARDLIESMQGSPVIVFYSHLHDLDRLREAFPEAETYGDDTMARWNAGAIPILLLHPKSAGHGLNLQHGGHTIIWYGLTWSLELYVQANARVDRQGQVHPVVVHHLIVEGTMDERIMAVLEGKAVGQDALMDSVKAELALPR